MYTIHVQEKKNNKQTVAQTRGHIFWTFEHHQSFDSEIYQKKNTRLSLDE